MQQHEGEISAVQGEQSLQLRVQESIEQRIGTEAELASHRANQVGKVRKPLGEVRELAEGAQRKAESTEDEILPPDFPKLFEALAKTICFSVARQPRRFRCE
jgi:hypothetical protein